MTTIRLRTRRSLKVSGPMVLVFPACLPKAKERAKVRVKVRVRDAEAKAKEKVRVKVTVKVKAKVRVKVKEKAKVKAKVEVRVNPLVPVQQQVTVVSSADQRSTGLPIVHRPAGGHTVPRREERNSAGMKRL